MIVIESPSQRRWTRAVWRGLNRRCPACGQGRLFNGYVSVQPTCGSCHTELHHQRADDAPPYFTIFVVGHIVVPLMLAVEKIWRPELWIHFTLWLPLTAILTWWLLPRLKGAVIGLQWTLSMHGFGSGAKTPEP
jgi:uncharacterized protein (DUF983 family)